MGMLVMAAENLVIRGEAVILLKAAIMHSVANIKEGRGRWRVFLLVATMGGGGGGGRRERGAGPEWSAPRGCQERSRGAQRRPKVARTSSPDRRHEQAGTLPLAFDDLYPPTVANGGAGPGSMHPEIGLPIPALCLGQPGRTVVAVEGGDAAGSLAIESLTLSLSQPAGDRCACRVARAMHRGRAASDRRGEKTAVISL